MREPAARPISAAADAERVVAAYMDGPEAADEESGEEGAEGES